ncbi:MAG: hypothetical protein ABSB28_08200 [Candidatus Bathyarchaeia archaeon]
MSDRRGRPYAHMTRKAAAIIGHHAVVKAEQEKIELHGIYLHHAQFV